VDLPQRPFARPGPPALIARSAANGLGIGRLTLEFGAASSPAPFLSTIEHGLSAITDRTPPDTALVRQITALATITKQERGELMFPAFVDIADRHPELRTYDAVTQQGRMSKAMWETFMARLIRTRGNAEVAVIRRLDQFPPLIGKLHENEIGAWLWTEDEIVLVDLLGADLRALLQSDTRGELATSGITYRPFGSTVLGHALNDQAYYRVATSDVLFDGARSLYFQRGRRVRRTFEVGPRGRLVPSGSGSTVSIKDFVFGELRRLRSESKGEEHIDRIAALIAPDPAYVNLLYFSFDRPTLSVSMNQVSSNEGYGSVPESRVKAKDSWVAGASGRLVLTQERRSSATDVGLTLAYARQSVAGSAATESSDDIKLDVTLRPSTAAGGARWRPFVRGLYDTEFSPTEAADSGRNPRQMAVRTSIGMLAVPTISWSRREIAIAVENDFGRPNLQYGIEARFDFSKRLGGAGRLGAAQVSYRMRNDLTYFFPSPRDTDANLALRYNMAHEFLIPLVDELSLSLTADIFFFQGKVAATRSPVMSSQLRIGLTYDRLWKPRYQPFF